MKYKIGDKVKFIDENEHIVEPAFFPPAGTIGTIVDIEPCNDGVNVKVEWGEESGVLYNEVDKGYDWWVNHHAVAPFDEEIDDVAALSKLVIKKQMEIQKLKKDIQKLWEDNERLLNRNTELNEMVICYHNLGLQIVNVGASKEN